MSAAIVGDVFIVLGVITASWFLQGRSMTALLAIRGRVATVTLGLMAGVLLEWLACIVDLWGYSTLMPTVPICGERVGLVPVIQISILPALSLYLAARFRGVRDILRP